MAFRRETGRRSGAVAVLVGLTLWPVSAEALSLQEALIEAYSNNPALQAARAALRAVDEGVPQALGGWRPDVELTADFNLLRERRETLTTDDRSTRSTSELELAITQNIYDGGGTLSALAGAKADVLSRRATLLGSEQTILLNVVAAYMDVLRDQAVVELNQQNTVRLERQLEATRDRFNAGVATLTDVAQAESRLARAQADLVDSRGDLEVSCAVFEEVVGLPATDLVPPGLNLDLPESRDAAQIMAVERNPSVLEAVYDRRSALHAIDEQLADLYPSFDIEGSASQAYDKLSRGSDVYSLQLSAILTVPIYQQGVETSEIREAKMVAAQALQEIEEARRDAVEQATSTWETYRTVAAAIVAIREEVRAAEIALDGVQQEELVGQRTVLDVLDAEQELLDAKVSLVEAQRDEAVAQYKLIAAAGALTARDLGLDVDYYDPRVHYDSVKGLWWGLGQETEIADEDTRTWSVEP